MSPRRAKPRQGSRITRLEKGYIRAVKLAREKVEDFSRYPFSIPALNDFDELELHPRVTFIVGENGSGKSTLIEAIAVAFGFNAEGGTKNFRFQTRRTESELHSHLRLVRGTERPRGGFFFRAESFYNVATEIENLAAGDRGILEAYGGKSLHERSHGEAFLTLAARRFSREGLFILDEPESALSPPRQLSLLRVLYQQVNHMRSQFVIATHSPIIMAFPDSVIYELSADGIEAREFEETDHFQVTSSFLDDRDRYFQHLFQEPDEKDTATL